MFLLAFKESDFLLFKITSSESLSVEENFNLYHNGCILMREQTECNLNHL